MVSRGSTDQPARVDEFGISNYVTGLCSFITDCDTPMTIAIQGDWGSGKTSVMEMVKDRINKEKNVVHCVWFNTWQFSQFNTADSLSLSLIGALVEGFGISEGEQIQEMRGGINRIGSALANLGKNALYVAIDHTLGSTTSGIIKDKIEKPENTDADANVHDTIATLKERFQACVDAAVTENKVDRVLVFIDDLDRLEPLRAVELLEVLKIFLDCEKCVFVLAIDYNVVVSGVKSKYGADFDESKGRSFFDKIIQVPFKMPVAQYDIYSFVKKTFENVAAITCVDSDVKKSVALINTSIGSNPRSMKRLFNSYLLLLKVMGNDMLEKDESKKALFAILCMQQRFESLYNYIVLNRDDREIVDAKFFNDLADSDTPDKLLEDKGVDTEAGDAERIKEFIASFNNMIGKAGDDTIDDDSVDRLRLLLKSSSITATDTTPSKTKVRPTFVYKGDTYMTQGANRMNLGNLALRIIRDYAMESDKTAEELMDMINSRIPAYWQDLKKTGLGQISERSNPALGKKNIKDLHFAEKNEIVLLGDKELIVCRGWGAGELTTLIGILGYSDRVSSNIM